MSFWRSKNASEIPPVQSDDSRRAQLLGNRQPDRSQGRTPSPNPPYRTPQSSSNTYVRSRDGDLSASRPMRQNSNDDDPYAAPPAAARNTPDRYNRNVGDPYTRSNANPDADRAQLFAGYNPDRNKPRNRFDERDQDGGSRNQEDEDEDVEAIKKDTRTIKQETVSSTRNALRIAREAEETARNTLLKLGDQSEKIGNTERHLDMSKAHANRAEDRTGELKQLNRSIFRPVIVFNKDAKRAAAEAKIQARHDEERDERERTMAGVRESQNRVGRAAGYGRGDEDDEEGLGGGGRRDRSAAAQGAREKARGRYQFEKTASDDELEDELDDNLDEILDVSKRLKVLAMAAGNEVTAQNGQLDKLGDKVSSVDSKVSRNTNALKRIK